MTVELRFLAGPLAVPLLMDLAKSTGHTLAVRNSAIAALEEMRDPRTLPDLARHLDDSDDRIQFNVLAAMDAMTQARQCSAPRGWSVDLSQVALHAATCRKWWKAEEVCLSGREQTNQ
jgi:HEAT repeat protein